MSRIIQGGIWGLALGAMAALGAVPACAAPAVGAAQLRACFVGPRRRRRRGAGRRRI